MRHEGLVGLVVGLVQSLDPGVIRWVTSLEKTNLFLHSMRLSRSGEITGGIIGGRSSGRSPGEITWEFTGGK